MIQSWRNALIALVLTTLPTAAALANNYLGLDLGVVSLENAKKALHDEGAVFEDDWGYKGYTKDLPSLKVLRHPAFEKHGSLRDAWLNFAPDGVLYSISLSYGDAGETFTVLKDALDSKYGIPRAKVFGFQQDYVYRDGKTEISLKRNTFGFGKDQTTELVYVWLPLTDAVAKRKQLVEADIRQKNAAKAGSDL